MKKIVLCFLFALLALPWPVLAVDYDIVYVRQPRHGDNANTIWPEVFHPARAESGADLMLRHPDGSREVLVDAGEDGAVTDPFVSLDGTAVYYAYFPDLSPDALNGQRSDLPYAGADIYRIDLATREITRLTFGEFTPNTGAGNWDTSNPVDPPDGFNRLGYGILNLGPCPLPDGRIAFTSNRNGFKPTRAFTAPTLQLYVMDENGDNVTPIAPMTIGSALHPTILRDGRLMFSSYESQGIRDRRLWGIWTIYPDGRNWNPLVSAFKQPQAFHFMTQLGDSDLVVEDYYNLNNNGFGALYRFPVEPPGGQPPFHSAFPDENPPIEQTRESGNPSTFRMPFTPRGMYSITPFTHAGDQAAAVGDDGVRVGKFTHPSAAPDNDLLVVWTPGPANDLNRPTPVPYYNGGIYIMPGGDPVQSPDDLVEIVNDPAWNEAWPRAVVPYEAIHGVAEPETLPWLPNDGNEHPELLAGTPYGLVGSSSLYKRESFPGEVTPWADSFDGLDAFNTSANGQSSNWFAQGADAGQYDNSDIWAIRILAMEPNTHRSYGPNSGRQFHNHANERLRILGELPVRKTDDQGDPVLDPEGNPDTSFLVKIPADTPFTFQTLDRNGMVLNMAQTWHQVRPGEARYDCGGCHAHSQQPLAFEDTAAADPDYEIADLHATTPVLSLNTGDDPGQITLSQSKLDVEFFRDIRPILQDHCTGCHTQADPNPPGNLVLDDISLYDGLPGDYARLAEDQDALWGYPPVISNGVWRQSNASRYVRKFQSRRSLLTWKVYGQRTDGWSNVDHPSAAIPGDPDSLPDGADPNDADIDLTGTIMPPPASGVEPLTAEEKLTIARWIDLGAPINTGELSGSGDYGWFLDDLKPTVALSLPRPRMNHTPVDMIRIGLADANSGVDLATLSITADFEAEGRPPGSELADLAVPQGGGIHAVLLSAPLPQMTDAELVVSVMDHQGNITEVVRTFSTPLPDLILSDGFE